MFLKTFPSGPLNTNAYLVGCPQTKEAVIIDPAPASFDALAAAIDQGEWKPVAIWLTHSHWDHIADVDKLKTHYQIPTLAVHSLDAPNLENPGSDRIPCWIQIPPVTPTHFIEEGDTLSVGNFQFHVIYTPGHTPGCVCFYCPETHTLFSGDTLFQGTIGNISFPTSRPHLMWSSLDKLAKLPSDTNVFPGHGPSTTIGKETWLSKAEELFGEA